MPHTHPSNPYDKPVPQPVVEPSASGSTPTPTVSGIIRENPWVQCKHEIAHLQKDLHKVSDKCPSDADLMSFTASAAAYGAQVAASDIQNDLNTQELNVLIQINQD